MAGLWLACLAVMALGLWADTRHTPAALLASECGAPAGLLEMAWRHASLMPVSSVAMVLAALAPWPSAPGAGRRLVCALGMGLGMVWGARVGVAAAQALAVAPFVGMTAGMAAGMALGMAASVALGILAGLLPARASAGPR